ncbi:MAG: L-threonylcarbamoyladenylate synthase [Lachnospiraceae bacterium]
MKKKATIVKIDSEHMDAEVIRRAGRIIKDGGLVAFPTETVYGLGGNALQESSSRKIYAAKGRPSDNPLIVHIYRMEDVERLTDEVPAQARQAMEHFWPGPLTVILQKSAEVPYSTTGGLETVAIRMPSDAVALALIEAAGGFVSAPSANTSGRPSPTLAAHVAEDLQEQIDMILDGGMVGIGLESTIVDFTQTIPTILRPGYITQTMLEAVLGEVKYARLLPEEEARSKPRAPGMKYTHYAPKAPLTIVEGVPEAVVEYINQQIEMRRLQGEQTGVMTTEESLGSYPHAIVKSLGDRTSEASIALHLYEVLRQFDESSVTQIYSEEFSSAGIGKAVRNRLLKAAGHHIMHV